MKRQREENTYWWQSGPNLQDGKLRRIDAVIVSHTHWDREWYRPFQEFRYRLVALVDRILDTLASEPDFLFFTLDGQTIVLEDYLALRPSRETRLKQLVQAGRLLIGPWYVLPDEFLVSGEAIVRNLILGRKICGRFGTCLSVGYVPDTFGHISQLPQIFALCGIDSIVLRRGLSDEPAELCWESPDGARLLTIYLRDGYDNAAWLPDDLPGFVSTIRRLVASLAPRAATTHVLLMNGTDHIALQPPNLPFLIHAANERMEDIHLRQGTLSQFIAAVRHDLELDSSVVNDSSFPAPTRNFPRPALPIVRGELRSPKHHHLLAGVLSTRMWIKQSNNECETALTRYAEPLAATNKFLGGRDLRQELWQSWRHLLQNQAHDSICGCSIDQVHEEMKTRFTWSAQIAEAVTREGLQTLGRHVAGPEIETLQVSQFLEGPAMTLHPPRAPLVLTVFNPTEGPRTDLATLRVPQLPPGQTYRLLDSDGSPAALTLENCERQLLSDVEHDATGVARLLDQMERGWLQSRAICDTTLRQDSPVELDVLVAELGEPDMTAIHHFVTALRHLLEESERIKWRVHTWLVGQGKAGLIAREVPGFGYRSYRLMAVDSRRPCLGIREQRPAVSGQIPSGRSRITDPYIENEFFRVRANPLEGTLTLEDKHTRIRLAGLNRLEDGGDRGDEYSYCPPAEDRVVNRPSAVPRIAIYGEGPTGWRLEASLRYRLPARLTRDRRRRSAKLTSIAVTSRVWLRPGVPRVDVETTVDNRVEDHRFRVLFPTPFQIDHALADGQFDLVTRALTLPTDTADWVEQPTMTGPQCAFVAVKEGEYGLLVANRGLPEYEVIPGPEGVTIALTLLRCVGWLSRDDLDCRSGHAGPNLPTPGAQCPGVHTFHYSLIPFVGSLDDAIQTAHAFRAPLCGVAALRGDGSLPARLSFFELTPPELIISAIKPADDGDGLIVRFWNISDDPMTAQLMVGFPVASAENVNLLEESLEALKVHDACRVELPVHGKQIVSVRIRPA